MIRTWHLGLLVAALSACGSEEAKDIPSLCHEDSDCSDGKFCGYDSNYGAERCLGPGSFDGEGGNGGAGKAGGSAPMPLDACGNSPLNGRYFWDIGNCESGSITPGDLQTCTLRYQSDHQGEVYLLHYDGLSLGPNEWVREVAFEDLMPYDENTCGHGAGINDGDSEELQREKLLREVESLNCLLSLSPDLYALRGPVGICLTDNISLITDSAYLGVEQCRSSVVLRPFRNRCGF